MRNLELILEIRYGWKKGLILILKRMNGATLEIKGHGTCLVPIGTTLYFFGDLIVFKHVQSYVDFQTKILCIFHDTYE